jgi:GNAT superfamily N-acetyltransferase
VTDGGNPARPGDGHRTRAGTGATPSIGAGQPPGVEPVIVRGARPSDVDELAAILAAGSLREAEDPSDPAPYQAALSEITATPGNEVLVAEVGGRAVGMCQLLIFRHLQERGGRCAEIESMHVETGHRSTGIGSALLAAAVARAAAAGCYRVQLTSNKTRIAAHRFYERHGFVASHEGYKRDLP